MQLSASKCPEHIEKMISKPEFLQECQTLKPKKRTGFHLSPLGCPLPSTCWLADVSESCISQHERAYGRNHTAIFFCTVVLDDQRYKACIAPTHSCATLTQMRAIVLAPELETTWWHQWNIKWMVCCELPPSSEFSHYIFSIVSNHMALQHAETVQQSPQDHRPKFQNTQILLLPNLVHQRNCVQNALCMSESRMVCSLIESALAFPPSSNPAWHLQHCLLWAKLLARWTLALLKPVLNHGDQNSPQTAPNCC